MKNDCLKFFTFHFYFLICHTLVGLGGLEPPTSRLSGVRSNQLSYRPILDTLLDLSKLNSKLRAGLIPVAGLCLHLSL